MTSSITSVAVVGAGVAGARCAETLRSAGFDGGVLLVGDERWAPYERPPLSKAHLLGGGGSSRGVLLHPDGWYADNGVELVTGARVEALDAATGGLRLRDGTTRRVDRVLLATGGRPRRLDLAGADAPNVHHLRSVDDADAIAAALRPGASLVIVGMGVVGAEVAASARSAGCDVTVVQPSLSPMRRTLGARFGTWLGQVHADHGVRCLLGTAVSRLVTGADGDVRAVECDDGTSVACDAVVVGIGIDPRVELARGAGLALGDGIRVDAGCRTSNPHVLAAGDVAELPGFEGGRVRSETFHDAAAQGAAAARSMLGEAVDHRQPLRSWTHQYDLEVQMVGRLDDALPTVVRGEVADAEFTALFLERGVVVGALAVNRAVDVAPMTRLVEQRTAVDPSRLGDVDLPLREALRSADEQAPRVAATSTAPALTPVPVPDGPAVPEPAQDAGVPLCRADDVEVDEPVAAVVDGFPPLAVYRVGDGFHVTQNTCTHGNAELSDGFQEGARIECPFHGGAFDVVTGAATAFPCVQALATFPARLEDGWVVVDRVRADDDTGRVTGREARETADESRPLDAERLVGRRG